MVCTANDLHGWKDFPKGLRILLLERDSTSASEIRAKLEAMDYHVSTFYDENEALSEISNRLEGFHVAIVEISTSSSQSGFKFLENAKDLPTIMTSDNQCLSTMMKCIALGAVEFLCKPLSEDKLRNIWQHVVHKAFNAGASALSESLKPVKESVESIFQLQTDNGRHDDSRISIDLENISRSSDNDREPSAGSDKYPAPSTPQLKQGARLLDDGDCQEHTNCSNEKESGEHEGESKSVEASSENLNEGNQPQKPERGLIKLEEDFVANGSNNGESTVCPNPHDRRPLSSTDGNITSSNKAVILKDTCENKATRKKLKVEWTTELHKKFVQAVEQLGVDQAIPSRVLELMKVEGLTRHNVASHLQKYRLHKRQMLPREEDQRWHHRDTVRLKRPIMAYPPHHYNHGLSPPPVYPMWGQPGGQTTNPQFWGPPAYTWWQPTENWHWKPFPGVHVDAWGSPVFPATQAPYHSYTQHMAGLHINGKSADYRYGTPPSSFEHYPADEVVDKVVKEAISKPWLPLPLGLKPPSTDSVLAELSRQGISPKPHGSKGSKPR